MFRRLHLYRWKPSSGHVYRVVALDGSTWTYELETRAKGTELLQLILRDLAIPDGDYFGLFQAENNRQWIILNKSLKKQLRGNGPHLLYLGVEVYPKDHNNLLSPTTRYQIYLQAKREMESKRMVRSSEMRVDLQTHVRNEAAGWDMTDSVSAATEKQDHVESTNGKSRDDCARDFLEVAQLEDNFGTFIYTALDSSRRPLSLSVGPSGLTIVGGTHVEWDSVSKVSSLGRHLTICTVDTMQETQAPPIAITFASSSLCGSVAAHCLRLKSLYSDLACESTKTKLKRLLSLRLGRDAIGKHSGQSPRPTRIKKTSSFSIRFRSFRNHHTILSGHSVENIAQSTPSSFNESIYRQQTHQIGSPIQYLSLSLTPPPSPTPVDCHVASSTDSCAHHIPETATSVVCDLTSPPLSQLCADDCSVNGCDQNNESNVPSEVGNLDSLLQTLEEKFKEQRTSSIYSDTDQHPGIVTTSSRAKRSKSATDIHCVKAKPNAGYYKTHLSSVELGCFSPPTTTDPHVRSLVYDSCQSQALGTEL